MNYVYKRRSTLEWNFFCNYIYTGRIKKRYAAVQTFRITLIIIDTCIQHILIDFTSRKTKIQFHRHKNLVRPVHLIHVFLPPALIALIHVFIEKKEFQDSNCFNLIPRLNNQNKTRALAMLECGLWENEAARRFNAVR